MYYKKSLLALSITAALASPAIADIFISGTELRNQTQALSETLAGAAPNPNITIDPGGIIFTVEGTHGILASDGTLGTITNGGTITTTAPGEFGILITGANTNLAGGIINTGSIGSPFNQGQGPQGTISDAGISIRNGASSGDIINGANGEIRGLNTALLLNQSTINGDLSNAGTIRAVTAVAMTNATISGNITNSGTISGSNGGIYVSDSSIGNITNSGNISSTGSIVSGLYAVHIRDSSVTGNVINNLGGNIEGFTGGFILDNSSMAGDLINNQGATIQGTGDAIVIRGANATLTGAINNAGGSIIGARGIVIEDGSTVTGGILNSGNISGSDVGIIAVNANITSITNEAGGIITAGTLGSILTVDGGSINAVINSGGIEGAVDFGLTGGLFTNNAGATSVDIINTLAVENSGIISGTTTFIGSAGSFINNLNASADDIFNANSVSNAGTLNNIALSNNTAVTVENSGVISGTTSFGDIGGSFVNNANANAGNVLNASMVSNSGSLHNITMNENAIVTNGNSAIDNLGIITGTTDFTGTTGDFFNHVGASSGDINNALSVYNEGITGNLVIQNQGLYSSRGGSSGTIAGASTIEIWTFNVGDDGVNANGVTTSTINGDLTFDGSLVLVNASADSTGFTQTPRLVVTGDVDVTGATVGIVLASDSVTKTGDEFSFLSAGGTLISDIDTAGALQFSPQGILVDDNSLIVDFGVEQRDNELFIVATSNDVVTPITDLLGDLANSSSGGNTINVAKTLSNILNNSNNGVPDSSWLGKIMSSMQQLGSGSEEELLKAVASLDPENVESTTTGAMDADAAAAGIINNRMATLYDASTYSGVAAGDEVAAYGFWLQAYNNETDQGITDGFDGFDASTYGFALGFDKALSEQVSMGAAFSYASTDVDSKLERNELAIDSYRLALYGSYNTGKFFLQGQAAYALNDYTTQRFVAPELLGLSTPLIANGDHDGNQYSIRIRAGYPIALSGWYLTPRAEMDYTFLQEGSYDETGAGNAGLSVSSDSVEVFVIGVGAKLSRPITTSGDMTWIPEFSLDYMYDTIGDEVEIDSNFIGVTGGGFIIAGAGVEQEMLKASIGLRAFTQGNLSFSARYDYIEKDNYDSQSIMATIRYDF